MKKEKNGVIEKVSDKEFFTNSMHVPVWEKVSVFEKIDCESQLTGYSSAGCITYIELDASAQHNIDALEMAEKSGYTFSGWDKELPTNMPAYDIDVYGTYNKNTYYIISHSERICNILMNFFPPFYRKRKVSKGKTYVYICLRGWLQKTRLALFQGCACAYAPSLC